MVFRKASIWPRITISDKTIKAISEIKKVWPKRLERARGLFLLDVAGYMQREVIRAGIRIEVDGKDKRYADDLRIGLIESGHGRDSIVIYLGSKTAKITQEYSAKNVLYFMARHGSPKWVAVLNKYGPWPAGMVPVVVRDKDAKTVSRRARGDEMLALGERLSSKRREIERELSSAGAKNPHVGNTSHGIGMNVHEDIGYNALRREFGLDGQKQEAHWRPAFDKTKDYAAKCMAKVAEYVQTGKENIFILPMEIDKVSKKVLDEGSGFAKEIAPFLK
jgi:hypothetical protein